MGAAVAINADESAVIFEAPPGGNVYLGEFGEALWAKRQALDHAVKTAAEWLVSARAILIGAGAGMGVDSGLGTYRGANMGVWPPLKELGIDYREICTPDAFLEDPQLTWAFWRYCMIAYCNAEPHEGYRIIQRWAVCPRLGSFCYTTNVDAMWPRILQDGCIYEAHGSTTFLQCCDARGSCPNKDTVWMCPENFAADLPLEASREDAVERDALPRCPACSKLARPNVNLFGDLDFSRKRGRIQKAKYQQWLQSVEADLIAEMGADAVAELEAEEVHLDSKLLIQKLLKGPLDEEAQAQLLRTPVVCLEIGAGVSIPTVRTAMEGRAALAGHVLIRINPEYGEIPSELEAQGRAISIPLSGADALQRIEAKMTELRELRK